METLHSTSVQHFIEQLQARLSHSPNPFPNLEGRGDLKDHRVPATQTALIIVDMQNVFVREECSLAKEGLDISMMQAAVPRCAELIQAARDAGVLVIYTRYEYMPGYADAPFGQAELFMANGGSSLAHESWDAQIADPLAPVPGEIIIDKSRPSSFYGTRLEPLLVGQGIHSLVICGVTTNICVETTARDAHQRGYETFVVADATAEFEISRQHHALFTINWSFGGVVTTDEVVTAWAPELASVIPEEVSV